MPSGTELWLRERRAACGDAFAFLVDEFGYRTGRQGFRDGGFELAYLGSGSGLGVVVDWFPRDPLSVWLVRLDGGGDLPPRFAQGPLNYFDLADVEAVSGRGPGIDKLPDLYVPSDASARYLADRLRACDEDLRGGALALFPTLARRVLDRAGQPDPSDLTGRTGETG